MAGKKKKKIENPEPVYIVCTGCSDYFINYKGSDGFCRKCKK
jgi:hypothetical protein